MRVWDRIAGATALRRIAPEWVKRLGRRYLLGREDYLRAVWREANPYVSADDISSQPHAHHVTLGVIVEFTHQHRYYIDACRELGVPYKLVDISGPDWIDKVRQCGCDAFLVKPSAFRSIWKQMFDERLKVMTENLGKIIYPSFEEIWLYESKRRMHYWLEANGIAHPKTWIFYDLDDALRFAESTNLPIVFKHDFGSGASGVRIIRRRWFLRRWLRRCFSRGTKRDEGDRRDREWGSVLLQEYHQDVREWRMVRIGECYFGHLKLKKGEFHSGSGRAGWETPSRGLLDLTRAVTDRGNFKSMALDVFETPDHAYLVNELQTVFGFRASRDHQMLVNGKPGRYLFHEPTGEWRFEEGDYSSGGCYKLRVEVLLESLLRTRQGEGSGI